MSSQAPLARRRLFATLPLFCAGALLGLFGLVFWQGRDSVALPSVLVGQRAPRLDLPRLEGLGSGGRPVPGLGKDMVQGDRVTVVNVFASWCAPCRLEHPLLMKLSGDSRVRLVGLNYKDAPADALRFLDSLGNPYAAVGVDRQGRAAIEWGVYGVPETFVISGDGTIRFKLVGPLTEESLASILWPEILKAQAVNSPR